MKKLIALVLVCVTVLGMVSAIAESSSGNPEVISYDFNLRFHLNADAFSFHERKRQQGYEDLLDMLEFRGNYSYCPATDSSDFRLEIVPVTNPSAKISFRVYGIRTQRIVTSSLFGAEKVSFAPAYFMHFANSVWEVIRLPLYLPALINPQITITAFRSIADVWNWGMSEKSSGKISKDTIKKIAEGWRTQFAENDDLNTWLKVITNPIPDGALVVSEIEQLPDMLLSFANGKPLRITSAAGVKQGLNASGDVLWEERTSDEQYSLLLNLPESNKGYKPYLAFSREEEEKSFSVHLDADWSRGGKKQQDPENAENYPDTILKTSLEVSQLPKTYPADAEFSGEIEVKGIVLPELHCKVKGKTTAAGLIGINAIFADNNTVDTFFSCTGTVVPVSYEGVLAFSQEELIAPFNLFEISFKAKNSLIDALDRSIVLGLIDFLYELPVSSCQSVMDDIENAGILKLLIK